ncbi:MAG TPA: DUF167 domain-containing protein [Gemmatimonadaceae bacterium]|jgi:hypothetical protein|nr:DUF167 domain-containing protein [Gemmatimonadaceae bacterium]
MAGSALRIDARDDAVRFAVHVQPRASRSEITGVHGDSMKVRLEAPPVEGAANAALIELLADALGVSRRNVQIVGGQRSRNKVVEVLGVGAESVRRLVTSGDR